MIGAIQSGRDVERLILEDRAEYKRLLESYWLLLGSFVNVADAAEAIIAAERGEQVTTLDFDIDDPQFVAAFRMALRDVREERARRDVDRDRLDRSAAALLTIAYVRSIANKARA